MAAAVALVSGCSLLSEPKLPGEATQAHAPQPPPLLEPLATHRFEFDPEHQDVVGQIQITFAGEEDTLADIARRFNLGYEEIVRANPGVDPWLPGDGTLIVLPTQFVLPDAPREGIVINIPAMRLFYFPPRQQGASKAVVITHPIGIGKVGWSTPEGQTKIIRRTKDPTWYVPASVREEHRKNGDPLPAVVPPGPDNPLGSHSLTLDWPSYLIHGTNKPYGVGMRSSHGCIRLYPEDISQLFEMVPVGTKVRVVNQPFLIGRVRAAQNEPPELLLQPYGALEDDKRDWSEKRRELLRKALPAAIGKELKKGGREIDWAYAAAVSEQARGVPLPLPLAAERSEPVADLPAVLAAARRVRNELPEGANWDGEVKFDAEKFQELLTDSQPQATSQ